MIARSFWRSPPVARAMGPASRRPVFLAFALLSLLALWLGMAFEAWYLALLPVGLLLAYLLVVDVRAVFYLLLGCIPLSTEIALPNGLGTDLPTEPLMLLLTGAAGLFALRHGWSQPLVNWRHPLTIGLLLHLGWIAVSALLSVNPLVSAKFLLAKVWYLVPFYFVAGYLIRGPDDLRRLFVFLFVPLTFTILATWVRHAPAGFSFAQIHAVLHPFYRNHVAYAAVLAVFFPYLWFMRGWAPAGSGWRLILTLAIPLYLAAIYLAYTRAAYVALAVALGAQVVIHFRLTRLVLAVALAAALGATAYFAAGNRYLDYAPNYERTVTHYDFQDLIEATYQLEDISTMERLYRWVAGGFMVVERPWFGYGPGNFYPTYKAYTVRSFETYVSDNPERSGVHNYYLMLLIEQGVPGLLIFVGLVSAALVLGERLYHRLQDRRARQTALMAVHSLIIILTLSIINDLLETDKIGPFFFLSLALLVNLDEGREGRRGPA